jgi:hypothetical protein
MLEQHRHAERRDHEGAQQERLDQVLGPVAAQGGGESHAGFDA